ncbi:MAG: efflux RND transporter periplasmic adaptor subunit [Eubacteriales bacterium]|nr:efflux RND transporter periplasmic adaptor subunit [Eubacteriales bacterium]
MKKRIAIVGGTVAAVAVAGGVSWYLWNHKGSSSEQNKVYVTTVATLMGDVSGTQNRYAGVVEPQKTVKVKVDSSRKVKTVKVKEGDQVHVGDVLFEYDESAAQDDLAQAELDLERLKNEANSLQNQIDTLTKEKKEAKEEEQLSYTIEIQTAQMNLKKNEYNQKTKEKQIEKLKNSSGDLEVKSELAGVIKKINESVISNNDSDMDSGSSDSGAETAFITIVATGTYRVKGMINETNMNSIVEGEPVLIRSRVDKDVTWTGVMTGVDTKEPESSGNNMDSMYSYGESSDTQTSSSNYPFYVELDSADGLILGQHVYIEPDNGQDEVKEGVWLDEFYLVDVDTEAPYVWASSSRDRLEKRTVSLGEYDENLGKYEITEGLTREDCIAFPEDTLEEGMETAINSNGQTPGSQNPEDSMDSSFDSGMDSSFDSSVDSDFEGEFDSSMSVDEEVEP